MQHHEQDPEGVFEEVAEILSQPNIEGFRPYAVTLSGNTAFQLLRRLHMGVFLSMTLNKDLDDQGINSRFLGDDHPDSARSLIYSQLVSQIPIKTESDDSPLILSAEGIDLPNEASLNLTLRDMDVLNEDSVDSISHAAKGLQQKVDVDIGDERDEPITGSEKEYSLRYHLALFLDLNNAFIDAGAPPRPAYTQFLQRLQGFEKR